MCVLVVLGLRLESDTHHLVKVSRIRLDHFQRKGFQPRSQRSLRSCGIAVPAYCPSVLGRWPVPKGIKLKSMCTAKKTPRMALVIPLLIGSCDKNLAQACIDYMSRVHRSNGNLQKDSLLYLKFVKIFLFAIDVATSLKSAMR